MTEFKGVADPHWDFVNGGVWFLGAWFLFIILTNMSLNLFGLNALRSPEMLGFLGSILTAMALLFSTIAFMVGGYIQPNTRYWDARYLARQRAGLSYREE